MIGIAVLDFPAAAETPPYNVGEKLEFKVYFEFVLGGTASMSVTGLEEIDGQPCHHLLSEAKSTSTVDVFYKVRDRVESWRDPENKVSRRYIKKLREGAYSDNKRVEYQPESSAALLFKGSREIPETLKIDGAVQDVLSAFYEVRHHDLEVGRSVFIDLHDIDRQYRLEVKVLRRERVNVPAGSFACFVIRPELQSSGLFRREGNMEIWLTDDERKMPVLMKSRLYFGRVWAKLTVFSPGQN